MDALTIGFAAAKILGGIFGNRSAKLQAKNLQTQAAITSNLAGGFSPGGFSNSFSNLASDLQQIAHNRDAQNQRALAGAA
jgi:hypothetical protein